MIWRRKGVSESEHPVMEMRDTETIILSSKMSHPARKTRVGNGSGKDR